jgi:GrpB-like predicted nucleotidyltransferase (UPF0157 family)
MGFVDAPIVLVEPDAAWPRRFEEVAAQLHSVLPPAEAAIEHIGSTSVPGLAAKPIIDILLGVRALPVLEARIPALCALGYDYVSTHEDQLPMRRFLVRRSAPLCVHVHGVVQGSTFWNEHLAFRDALRRDAALAAAYEALKRRLAVAFREDREAYTDAKAAFIRSVIDSA